MKIYSLSGKSGTGKSFQAVNLCKQMHIDSIIDDGLFICQNKIISGISAKRQPTKISAVKTALFIDDKRAEEAKDAIRANNPASILVLGTSDEMIDKIIARLELPEPDKRIYIEDITTEKDRDIAYKQRKEMGQHVIPVPTFQIKRQFSGYFLSPMKTIKDFGSYIGGLGPNKDASDKSVVRPTFSYLGKYNISEKVMTDIVECIKKEGNTVYEVLKVIVTKDRPVGEGSAAGQEGIEVYIVADLRYGENLPDKAEAFQKEVAEKIEEMTAFNVNRVDIEIRDII